MLARYVSLALLFIGCSAEQKVESFQIRVVWDSNPQTEARIVWTEDDEHKDAILELSTQPDLGDELISPDVTSAPVQYDNTFLFEENGNPYASSAQFSNLIPDTTYYFRISNDNISSDILSFRTAPESYGYTVIFGGDSRSNIEKRRKMNRTIASFMKDQGNILALVHGGDYVANGNDWRQWSQWLNDYALVNDENRVLPIIPTRGNHETNQLLYQQIFGFSEDQVTYFTTKLANLSIVTLDSELSVLGDQYDWLEQQLDQASENSDAWTFTNYHRPAYPAVKLPGPTKKWVPLFEDFGVDIAFESDGHTFKRTSPIWQDEIDYEKGVIYMGEGGLGVKLRQPKPDRWYFRENALTMARYHFIAVTVGETQIQVRSIDQNMDVFDEFILKK